MASCQSVSSNSSIPSHQATSPHLGSPPSYHEIPLSQRPPPNQRSSLYQKLLLHQGPLTYQAVSSQQPTLLYPIYTAIPAHQRSPYQAPSYEQVRHQGPLNHEPAYRRLHFQESPPHPAAPAYSETTSDPTTILSIGPTSPPSPKPRQTRRSGPRLTRDQRRDILLLRRRGDSYASIATFLNVTFSAVQYTVNKGEADPQHKNSGRRPKLSKEEGDQLEAFLTSSAKAREMTYAQLAQGLWPGRGIGVDTVRYVLHQRGYKRRIGLSQTDSSELSKM